MPDSYLQGGGCQMPVQKQTLTFTVVNCTTLGKLHSRFPQLFVPVSPTVFDLPVKCKLFPAEAPCSHCIVQFMVILLVFHHTNRVT